MSGILLTSFTTWLPQQTSNSADDLLVAIAPELGDLPLSYCRQLPVNTDLAWAKLNEAIDQIQPQLLICCGMAAARSHLCLETGATLQAERRWCRLPLATWITDLPGVVLSDDAGRFVCNALYYRALSLPIPAVFVHVPRPAQGWEQPMIAIVRRAAQSLSQALP